MAVPNQRAWNRAPFRGSVRFYNWDQVQTGEVTEISAGGLFLSAPELSPEGTHLTLRLSLPGNSRSFTVLGQVVRTVQGSALRPAGMGIRFIDIAAQDRKSLDEFVSSRSPESA
ncbi:MAG: PilZ domain-containing protein [Myxococcaceae bacterium]